MNNKTKQKTVWIVLIAVLLCIGVLLTVVLLQRNRSSDNPTSPSSSASNGDDSDDSKSNGLDVVDPEKDDNEPEDTQVPFKPAEDHADSDENSAQNSQPSSADSQPDKSTPEKPDGTGGGDNTSGSDSTKNDSLKDQNDTGTAYGKFY